MQGLPLQGRKDAPDLSITSSQSLLQAGLFPAGANAQGEPRTNGVCVVRQQHSTRLLLVPFGIL